MNHRERNGRPLELRTTHGILKLASLVLSSANNGSPDDSGVFTRLPGDSVEPTMLKGGLRHVGYVDVPNERLYRLRDTLFENGFIHRIPASEVRKMDLSLTPTYGSRPVFYREREVRTSPYTLGPEVVEVTES